MDRILSKRLRSKKVIIWGSRIVGIGFKRACHKEGICVHSFIDSDPGMIGRIIGGVKVEHPESLLSYSNLNDQKDLALVLAVSIKEDEIKSKLMEIIGENHIEIIGYKEFTNAFYTIDIVGACNLKCLSCAHSIEGDDVPQNAMKFDDIKLVLEKIKGESPNTSHVSLYSWGEPFLHPKAKEVIQLFHSEGIAVGLSTNLSHERFETISKVLLAQPDYLKISLSGYYPDAYNATHQGGNITLVKSNLYKLKYFIDKHKLDIIVDINYHLYRDNAGENLVKMSELARELGFIFSSVHALVMPLERVINYIDGNVDSQTEELNNNLLVDIKEGINVSKTVPLKSGCPFKHNQLNINSDLTVPVCCLVYNRDNLVAKNYLDIDINEINANKQESSVCHKCMALNLPQYNMGFNKDGWNDIASNKKLRDIGQKSNDVL